MSTPTRPDEETRRRRIAVSTWSFHTFFERDKNDPDKTLWDARDFPEMIADRYQVHNIELVRSHLTPQLAVSTILLTMYDGRTKLADQVTAEVRKHFGEIVLRTVIPRSVKVSEAPGFGQTVLAYDPGSRGSMSYLDAAREMAERGFAGK